jgi:hypothetical protein
MPISTVNQAGLNAPLTLTSPVLNSPAFSGTPTGTLVSANMPTGCILQVVNANFTNYTQTSSSSYATITGATISITPKAATNKILMFINLVGLTKNSGTNGIGAFQLMRNGSGIFVWDALVGYIGGTTTWSGQSSTNYLDSPATTSAITYTLQWKISNGGTLQINNYETSPNYSTSTWTLMEVAA